MAQQQTVQKPFRIYPNEETKASVSTCTKCNHVAPKVTVPRIRKWGWASRVRMCDIWALFRGKPNYFALLLGMYGSGKTSYLMSLILWFFSNAYEHSGKDLQVCPSQYGKGYMVVFRALRDSYEYLALCDVAPVKIFIPKGAKYRWNNPRFPNDSNGHPNLEIVEHEVNDFSFICKNLVRDKINIIAINHFLTGDPRYEWWYLFFRELLRWKNSSVHNLMIPMLFAFDELKDFVPNRDQTTFKAQYYYGNLIRELFDSCRKAGPIGIKIVGTTHTLKDLKKVVRDQFVYWVIKKTVRESVPERFEKKYGRSVIERLWESEMFVRDYVGHFNVFPSSFIIQTEGIFAVDITVPEDLLVGLSKEAQLWMMRTRALEVLLRSMLIPMEKLGLTMGMKGASSVQSFEKRIPVEAIPWDLPFKVKLPKAGKRKKGMIQNPVWVDEDLEQSFEKEDDVVDMLAKEVVDEAREQSANTEKSATAESESHEDVEQSDIDRIVDDFENDDEEIKGLG